MSKGEKAAIVVVVTVLLGVVALVVWGFYMSAKNDAWSEWCREAGGIPVAVSDRVCVKPEGIIPNPKEDR